MNYMSELISKIVGKTYADKPTPPSKSSYEIETQTNSDTSTQDVIPKSFQSQKQIHHQQSYLKEQKFPASTSEFLSQKQRSQLINY